MLRRIGGKGFVNLLEKQAKGVGLIEEFTELEVPPGFPGTKRYGPPGKESLHVMEEMTVTSEAGKQYEVEINIREKETDTAKALPRSKSHPTSKRGR